MTKIEAFEWLAEQAKVSKIRIQTDESKHKIGASTKSVYSYLVQAHDKLGRGMGGRGKTLLEAIQRAKG